MEGVSSTFWPMSMVDGLGVLHSTNENFDIFIVLLTLLAFLLLPLLRDTYKCGGATGTTYFELGSRLPHPNGFESASRLGIIIGVYFDTSPQPSLEMYIIPWG